VPTRVHIAIHCGAATLRGLTAEGIASSRYPRTIVWVAFATLEAVNG